VVTTSNRAPSDLYKDGLNREHFLPFIALIEDRLDVHELSTVRPIIAASGWATARAGSFPPTMSQAPRCRAAFFRLTDYPPEDRAACPHARYSMSAAGGCCMSQRR
jgi:cell division protein ZapE